MSKVFINPGHDPIELKDTYDYDCGAWNPEMEMYENEVAAEVAELVAGYLQAAGCEVMVFQDESLATITDTSDEWDSDVFVSIHCNAANTVAQGTETFGYYNSAKGKKLATCIHNQITEELPELVDRGVKTAGFYVIKYTNAPAALVEMAFIDNNEDAIILRDKKDNFARAIARGITDYLSR